MTAARHTLRPPIRALQTSAHTVNDPAVSILIPTYNRAPYLREAVESAFSQTMADLEVIVVDDGSTDETPALLESLARPGLVCLRQENLGVSAAFNAGLRVARGGLLITLGSDDRLLPEFLASTAPLLLADPRLVVVYARCQAIDERGTPLPRMAGAPPRYPDDMLASLLYGDHLCAIGALMRRDAVLSVGAWDTTLIGNEDWDLWLRLACVGEFRFVDRALAQFRVHPGRLTGHASPRLLQLVADRKRVLTQAYERLPLTARSRQIRGVAFRNLYIEVGMRLLPSAGWRAALPYFARSLRAAPALPALARIAWQVMSGRLLAHHAWGVRIADWVAQRSRPPAQ
jgi:glycosyltransferase involved in cell wall biosynthesis